MQLRDGRNLSDLSDRERGLSKEHWSGARGGSRSDPPPFGMCWKRSIVMTNKMEIRRQPDFQERERGAVKRGEALPSTQQQRVLF